MDNNKDVFTNERPKEQGSGEQVIDAWLSADNGYMEKVLLADGTVVIRRVDGRILIHGSSA